VPKHEEFESLCALAFIGELSAEEQAELISDMRGCESCCRSAREFVDVMQHLPTEREKASDCETRELEETARMRLFLSRATQEGVVFSPDALGPKLAVARRRKLISMPRFVAGPALAAALLLGVGLAALLQRPRVLKLTASSAPMVRGVTAENAQSTTSARNPGPQLEAELHDARNSSTPAQQKLLDLNNKLEASEKGRLAAKAELQDREKALADLKAKAAVDEQQLAQANADATKIQADRNQAVASLIADESRMRDLEAALSTAQAAMEQEKELNGAAHDVRELMGARKLHIIDVYDSDSGSRDRSFGRVIYTEGKSLIFYAFDLDKARNVKKVSFQAWGEREGEHRDAKKLGVFFVDDATQKRWVLKVNDPEKLKAIDTVFVTVENHQDANVPNHQRLLQAYLGSTANHP